jgi:hypothetical protein
MASSTAALAARMVVKATMTDTTVDVEAMEETATVQTGKAGDGTGKERVIATSGHVQLLVSSQSGRACRLCKHLCSAAAVDTAMQSFV